MRQSRSRLSRKQWQSNPTPPGEGCPPNFRCRINRKLGGNEIPRADCYDDTHDERQEKDYTMTRPYQAHALNYLASGLGYPIPSTMPYEKFPPVTGYTGRMGAVVSASEVLAWMDEYPQSNILLRLAPDVIGIDVDHYDDKHGGDTIVKASTPHGMLPATPYSSARGAGPSGIRYYRLTGSMDERQLKGDFGPDSHVEVIRYSHRYAVVPPSWHQGAERTYQWHNTDGGDMPRKAQLPDLPFEWYRHLKQSCNCFQAQREVARQQITRYKTRPRTAQGTMLAQMDFENNIETLEHLPKGSRNNYLSRVAGRTFLFDCFMNNALDFDEVWTQLVEAALDAGLGESEAIATLHSAKSWALNMNEGDNT
jgi:hypothetical protein